MIIDKTDSSFSISGCLSMVDIGAPDNGRPKYLTGSVPIVVPKSSKQWTSSGDDSYPVKIDLSRLNSSYEKFAKRSNTLESFRATSTNPSAKNVVSFAYCSKRMPSG